MKTIVPQIRQSDQGESVANLQQALASLDFHILMDERIAGFFGETTFSALRRFQESFQIPVTGIVDEATAKTLNEVLRHKQLLDKDFRVSGHVFDTFGHPMEQVSVVAFDVDLRGVPLIQKVTNVGETMQTVGFQRLESTITNSDGYYQIEFDTENFITADKSHADIICFLTQEDRILERSRLTTRRDYAGNEIQNLDIRLSAEAKVRGLPEHELLLRAIAPILRASALSLGALVNNPEQIDFLAQETDTDAFKLILAAQAEALLFGRTELSGRDFLYALGRENVGLTFGEITDFIEQALVEKIKAAITKNIIAVKTDEAIKDFVVRLLRLATSLVLTTTRETALVVQNFNRSLDIALKTPALKTAFLTAHRHFETNADPQQFWSNALPEAGLNADQIQSLKVTNQLHLLTGGHTDLVEVLQVVHGISSPASLIELSDQEWMEAINKAGLPESIEGGSVEARSKSYISNLRNVLHASYPTQKIASMVQKGDLKFEESADNLIAFFNKAGDFDFANQQIADFEQIIQEVAPQQTEPLRSSLQTLQRVFQISPTPEALSGMISNGITSAFQVAGVPEAAFVKNYAKALGGEGIALSAHSRANYVVTKANDTLMTTYELTHAVTPAAINVGNLRIKNAVTDAIKKHIPNYENIFGQADICECRDCRSINSPAAYLVDVMRFLSKLPVNTAGNTPLEVLSDRRPDLAHLPLTCENTNTVIPYIDLVNEVLEYYVANDKLDKKAANDTGNATSQELRATPQYRVVEAYKKLSSAVYPFNLPYHQPLDTIRTFFPNASGRYGLMKTLNQIGAAVVAENLNLSQKEYAILTGQNFDGTPEGTDLWSFYGFTDDNALKLTVPAVKEVLKRTGISYVDLVALIKTRFLNPAQITFDYIQDLFKDFPIDPGQPFDGQKLYEGLRDINADVLDPDNDFNFKAALERRGIPKEDFITWVKSHFESLKTLVTLYEADSGCDISTTSLRTLEQIYEASPTTLNDAFLNKMHRLIRLWHKTGWHIEELDTLLTALQATDLSPTVLQQLGTIKTLFDKTNLPLDRLATAWGLIETHGEKSLYHRLFLNRTISQIDKVFQPDNFGNFLSDTSATIGGHLDAVLAAFKIKKEDFDRITSDSGFGESAQLNLANLSVLYRYVALSKILKLNTADFVLLKNLFTIDPFSIFDAATEQFTVIDPELTLKFVNLVKTIQDSEFKAKELSYIFTGLDGNVVSEKIAQTLISIRSGFQKIETEYPAFSNNLNVDEAFLKAQMSLITPPENVELFFGIINGNKIFNAKTQENQAIAIPGGLKTKVQYIKAKGILSVSGVLTNVEKSALENLAGATPNFIKAVNNIFKLPEEQFVAAFLSYFDNPAQAAAFVHRNAPIADAALLAEWKTNQYKAFYQKFLPVLKHTLRENVTIQNIAALVNLTEAQTTEILKGGSLADLVLGITDNGLSATYFRTLNWTDVVSERTDKTVNFSENNAFNVVGLPLDNLSVLWEGYISSPLADEFTFILNVAGSDDRFNLYLDDVLILQKPDGNNQTSWEVAQELTPNRLYHVKLEYADRARASGIKLSWRSAKTAEEIIPPAFLFTETSFIAFTALVNNLHRGATAINKYPLSIEEVKHLLTHNASFANLDFLNLTPAHWLILDKFSVLKQVSPEADWLLIFETTYHPAMDLDDVIAVAAAEIGWGLSDLDFLIKSQFGFTITDLQTPENWFTLANAFAIILETEISASRLGAWATPETDFDKLDGLAKDVQNAVRAKYEDKDWTEFAPTVNNPLRERRRDALVSYLLVQEKLQQWGVIDADSLYEYFLIDVQMGACMDTSRVRQAMSSVQLFVTRCLLNLERQLPEKGDFWVSPEQIKAQEWEWMKLYRVWEANRKVFIHPENWLEPEWRDDRSPFFKELEAELTQNDISTLTVESSFRHYLRKLQEVSILDVVGVYNDAIANTLHVVARSYGASSQFYYRNRNKYGRWSGWENLGLDIKTAGEGDQNGVHVMPIRWKGRLFLFWLEFTEISKPDDTGARESFEKTAKNKKPNDLKGQKAWKVYLAWSESRDNKWLPKQMSKVYMESSPNSDLFEINELPSSCRPVIRIQNDKLIIQIPGISGLGFAKYLELQSFILTDVEAKIEIGYTKADKRLNIFSGGGFPYFSTNYFNDMFMRSGRNGTLQLSKQDYLKSGRNHVLAFDNQLLPSDFEADIPTPFFYQDGERNYFIQPRGGIKIFDQIKNIESVPYLPYLEMATAKKVGAQATTTVKKTESIAQISALKTISYSASGNDGDIGRVGLMSKTASSISALSPAKESIGAFSGVAEIIGKDFSYFGYLNWNTTLKFENFYHAYTDVYIERLNHGGINELLSADTFLADDKGNHFKTNYQPVGTLVDKNYPPVKVEFDENSAFGLYNWELFFHAPLYIATRLSKNGKYAEAMQWFHYLFNPMTTEKPDDNNTHFWQVPPFKIDAKENIEEFFLRLANKEATKAATDKIAEWRENPFKPHLIARGRPVAYMKNVVMKYVENLIAWGDDLFRRDTMESINEATQLYIIAAHILGPRPQFIPKRGLIKAETFASLQPKLDAFGNALVQMENLFPYSSSVPTSTAPGNSSLLGVGSALYFCIPNNANLLKYWDTVGDRLFKLRHCMNIDGVERKLALFDPPIDPAVLIAATAKGLSLGSILSDLFSPSPLYRFRFLLDKAIEICSEVRTFGNQLLDVLEKKDAADLALMRASHESNLLKRVEDVKTWQVIEARNHRETLIKTRETALTNLRHNLKLMAIKSGSEGVDVPPPPQTNTAKKPKKDDELARDIVINGIGAIAGGSEDQVVEAAESSLKLIAKEKFDLDVDEIVKDIKLAISAGEAIGKVLSMIPQFSVAAKPFGVGAGTSLGGVQLSKATEIFSKVQDMVAAVKALEGKKAVQTADYVRREQGWVQEAKIAVADVYQIDRQIVVADVRIAIAENELAIHQDAIKNSEDIENFIKTQFTNSNLYQFMKERLFTVYKQTYQLAYDLAKTAEKGYRQELGIATSNFVQYGYFDSALQGLTAGEQLHLALRQMEKSYLNANKREFEITKNLSLAAINTTALTRLKTTGVTEFDVPEEIFDLDYAGHYFRRIKSVSISIPCQAGPNTTIAATLRLLKNSVRINTSGTTYERNNEDGVPIDDERFIENIVPFKAVATSHGLNDAGVFELNFNDDRYLPFEGAGVISRWKLEMPAQAQLRQFDYNTITDAVLHIKYTAREDVGLFKNRAITHLLAFLQNP